MGDFEHYIPNYDHNIRIQVSNFCKNGIQFTFFASKSQKQSEGGFDLTPKKDHISQIKLYLIENKF